MTKNKIFKGSIVMILTLLFIAMTISTAQLKATEVDESKFQLADTEYTGNQYVEGIEIYPLKDTSVGIHVGFIGGTVELPFDVRSYSNLEGMQLIVANQAAWQAFSQKRFWDVADGASLMLAFRGLSTGDSLTQGNEIAAMIGTAYNFSLSLVFGTWSGDSEIAILVYQGRLVDESVFDSFTDDFTSYVSDDGFGEGITSSVLNNAPVKAMGISLIKGRYLAMLPALDLVPVLECAWVNPNGLEQNGTVMDMSLLNIMPDLTDVSGASNALVSVVSMDLPYVVDVLEIDPDTDNMYPHLKGKFEWVVKVDLPGIWERDLTYDDIFVSYDLNLTDMCSYPQVIGELSLNSSLPYNGGQDIEYIFTWENVGDEIAYNVTLAYGEFAYDELDGFSLIVENPDLSFDENKVIYYNTTDGYISDMLVTGSDIYTIEGWFYNDTSLTWLGAGEYYPDGELDDLIALAYTEQTFLHLDIGDFDKTNLTDVEDHFTLTTTIAELAPGENVSKSFAVRDLPTGTVNIYNSTEVNSTSAIIFVQDSPNWEEYFTILLRMVGSSLHIPEDQVTWTNWFPQEVAGSAFIYTEADGTEYMGLTNGLVIQVYDDEAVLVGKVSLDKDVYRFGENVTFTLELENIGNADATDVDYQFYHAFVTDDFELGYIEEIHGSEGTISLIAAGETVTVEYTETATTNVGLHPVFAVFGYTSDELDDPRDVPAPLPWYLTEGLSEGQIAILEALVYSQEIFGTIRHDAVISSMDFGIVLPPESKEGTTQPTYPTPEVEVTTELIGLTNDTKVGDELTLRTTITNVGDEPTNIIYLQRIPDSLRYIADTDSVTIEGIQVLSYDTAWRNPTFGMTWGAIADDASDPNNIIGIPLGVNETMVVEVTVEITSSGEIFIPAAEIRFNSAYNMTSHNGINDDSSAPTNETQTTILNRLYDTTKSNGITTDLSINAEDVTSDRLSTNSWGSYSESLTISIQSLGGLSPTFIYIGIGLIAVTGVAVLIYFRANGKKH